MVKARFDKERIWREFKEVARNIAGGIVFSAVVMPPPPGADTWPFPPRYSVALEGVLLGLVYAVFKRCCVQPTEFSQKRLTERIPLVGAPDDVSAPRRGGAVVNATPNGTLRGGPHI